MIFLDSTAVRERLSIQECITAVEAAFRLHGEGKAQQPGVLGIHAQRGAFHIKAGVLDLSRPYFAAKTNANFPGNVQRYGLPTIQGVIALFDAERGTPLAILDSREITSLRTGAATAVATKYLARGDASVAMICGCGVQGRTQLAAVAAVRPLRRAYAVDRDRENAARFAREMSSELGIEVIPNVDLAAAARESDICVTCTPSRQAILGPVISTLERSSPVWVPTTPTSRSWILPCWRARPWSWTSWIRRQRRATSTTRSPPE
jgi:alanine dehydrogenase